MKCMSKCRIPVLLATAILFSIIANFKEVHAIDLIERLKDSGIRGGGWVNAGATYNPSNPDNGYNGTVTFADRANRFQLNQ
ncbi:MAG TPA: outer membrane beta-barrel protein, partial [Nitrosospira sp.]|nr:outer membrane beta-barrel protein [Nitrosospira sp.]